MKSNFPYESCHHCRDIGDCPHPDVDIDGLGSPIPPLVCPRPMEIIKATKEKKAKRKFLDKINKN